MRTVKEKTKPWLVTDEMLQNSVVKLLEEAEEQKKEIGTFFDEVCKKCGSFKWKEPGKYPLCKGEWLTIKQIRICKKEEEG